MEEGAQMTMPAGCRDGNTYPQCDHLIPTDLCLQSSEPAETQPSLDWQTATVLQPDTILIVIGLWVWSPRGASPSLWTQQSWPLCGGHKRTPWSEPQMAMSLAAQVRQCGCLRGPSRLQGKGRRAAELLWVGWQRAVLL